MNELLKVSYASDRITVSARELHKALEVHHRFNDWFNTNKKMLIEEVDYTTVPVLVEVDNNGGFQKRQLNDYQLTIEAAKHICMMSRTEKGREVRNYFIQLEKDWNSPEKVMARALQIADQKIHHLETRVAEMKPKELFADAVSASKSSILVGDLAKLLKQNGVDIGQKRLFQWLREKGYLIKQQGASWNMPTQRSMEQGLFEVKETTITHSDGHISISKTVKVTGKGQVYFINKLLAV